MRLLRLIALVTLTALPAAAQEENEADKTYLEGWIEEALSGAGRSVTITGFRGALSSIRPGPRLFRIARRRRVCGAGPAGPAGRGVAGGRTRY